jgi:hypothetical protein
MRVFVLVVTAAAAAVLVAAPASAAPDRMAGPTAGTAVPRLYKNCTNFNTRYRHGVGKRGARDRTKSASSEPVTNFLRSTVIYNRAMRWNKGLDGDKDGVACEKR